MIRGINVNINKVFQLGQSFINEKLKEYNLSSGLFYFLLELANKGEMSMQELSKSVNVDNGYTTRSISKLVDLGYVKKTANPKDSRSSIVQLTEKGELVSEEVKNVMLEWINIISKDVDKKELETVNAVFDKFLLNAKNYLDNGLKNK